MTDKAMRNNLKQMEGTEKGNNENIQNSVGLAAQLRNYVVAFSTLYGNMVKEMIENTTKFGRRVEDEDNGGFMKRFCQEMTKSMLTILEGQRRSLEVQAQIREDLKGEIKSHGENRKEIASSLGENHREMERAMKHLGMSEKNYNVLNKKNMGMIAKMEKMTGLDGTLTMGRKAKQQMKMLKQSQDTAKATAIAGYDYGCNLKAVNLHLLAEKDFLLQMMKYGFSVDAGVCWKVMELAGNMRESMESGAKALEQLAGRIENLEIDGMAQVYVDRHMPHELTTFTGREGNRAEVDESIAVYHQEMCQRWLSVYKQSNGKLVQLDSMQQKLENSPAYKYNVAMSLLMEKAQMRKTISKGVLEYLGQELPDAVNQSTDYLKEDFCDIYATTADNEKKAEVLYEYKADGDNEIDVTEGEVVDIVGEYSKEDWCYVKKMDGSGGYVPGAYIEPI